MSLTSTQIDEIFAAMGLPAPSSAVATSLEAIPNTYDALNTIIDLPEVQSEVIPILAMFDLSLGHDPTSATLASMVENNGGNIASIANQFVESQTFANLYNAGTLLSASTIVDASNSGIITALFVNGLGHPPTTATLEGFFGLTLGQAFLDFTQSNAIAETPTIDASLTNIMELAAGIPAQAPVIPSQSFTLTNGSDTVIAGENTVGTTAPGTLVIQSTAAAPEDTVINAPLSGPFGNQPTLTSGDVIDLSSSIGGANSLNANFDGSDIVTGVTIKGVQTWTINQAGGGSLFIQGVPGAIDGLTSLTFNGNGLNAENLQVGIPGAGIDATTPASGFSLNVNNVASNPVTGIVTVYFDPKSFSGDDTINVNANAVTNTMGNTNGSQAAALFINAGSGGTAGFATWNVNSTGANALNDIALGTLGSTAATTLNVTDDGSATIIWADQGGGQWANLMTVDASGTTGTLTITGAENGPEGLLSADTSALTEVVGGSGADTFDLSAFGGATGGSVAGLSIFGGLNTTIELSNTEINFVSAPGADAFANWSSVAVLDDVGVGGGSDVGGAINMAEFPGTNTVTLLNEHSGTFGINQNDDFNVTNAMDGFTFNFNDTNEHGYAFSVVGTDTTGGASNVVNINYTTVNATGTFTSENFDNVNVNISGHSNSGAAEDFYTGSTVPFGSPDILVIGNADFNSDVGQGVAFNIDATVTHNGNPITINVGDISTGSIGDDSITLLSGPITGLPLHPSYLDTGTLNLEGSDNYIIGVTNADVINSTTTGTFDMTSPDDANTPGTVAEWLPYDGVDVTAASAGSLLQGTLGAAGSFKGFPILDAGNDSLIDTAGGTSFYGDGGSDSIQVGNGATNANSIYFGEYQLNDHADTQPIENAGVAADGFWGAGPSLAGTTITGSTSADLTTITGFTVGSDNLAFNVNAWSGGNTNGDLDNGANLTKITDASASGSTVFLGTAGITLGTGLGNTATGHVDLILDGINNQSFANASQLAASIATEGVGNFNLGTNLGNHGIVDLLVAYFNGTNVVIADVELQNHTGSAQHDTGALTVYASDMVSLVGVTSLASLGTTANATHIHFDHIV